jgi:uncharacterized protein (DUF169 family)
LLMISRIQMQGKTIIGKEIHAMNNVTKLGEELDNVLKLRTPSLGIKFFEKIGDIPKEFEVVKDDVMVCQVIGMARYNEQPVAATKDSATACGMGGASIGLYKPPANMLDGTRNAGAWAEDAEAAKKLMQGRLLIEAGKFEAFGVCPLRMMSVEPDVIEAFGTPEQMLACVYANIWDGGDKIELSTNGHGASCNEALSVPYLTGKIRLAIADIGERRHAGAQDEMIIGLPVSQLERLVGLLKKATQTIYKYPFKPYIAPVPEPVLKRISIKH